MTKIFTQCCEGLIMLDAFGRIPQFYYKNSRYQQTKLGFVMTILLILFCIGCIIYFGGDVINRKNPEVIRSDHFSSNPQPLEINPKLRPFIMEINDPSGTVFYTDLSLIKPQVIQVTLTKLKNRTEYNEEVFDMEICNETHFSELKSLDPGSYTYFMKFNLTRFFCVPDKVKALTVEGTFDNDVFKVVKFSFNYCKAKDHPESSTCKAMEEIRKILGKGYMGLYFQDFKLDPANHESPWKSSPHELFTNYIPNSRKNVDIFMKNNVIITDDGILFESLKNENFHNFEEQRESYFLEDSEELISMTLKMKQEYVGLNRKYKKIQDLLAYISGFVNVFWVVSYILCYLYTHVIFFADLINDIFTIKYYVPDDEDKPAQPKERVFGKNVENIPAKSSERIYNHGIDLHSPLHKSNIGMEAHRSINLGPPKIEKPEMETPAFELGRKMEIDNFNSKSEEQNMHSVQFSSVNGSIKGPLALKKEPCKPCEDVSEPDVDSFEVKFKQKEQNSFVTLRTKNLVLNFEEEKNTPPRSKLKKTDTFQFETPYERVTKPNNSKFGHSCEKNRKTTLPKKDKYKVKKMKIGLWDMWYYYTNCCGSKRVRRNNFIFEKLKDILTQQLDIRIFVERIYDFEKLKMLLLSERELENFDKLPKPEILIHDTELEKKNALNFQMSLLNRKISQEKGLKERFSFLVDTTFSNFINRGKKMFKQKTNEI